MRNESMESATRHGVATGGPVFPKIEEQVPFVTQAYRVIR